MIWFLVALFVAVKKQWFRLNEPLRQFPFSLSQFLTMFLLLVCAFGLFMGALYVAHLSIQAFRDVLPDYGSGKWVALEQVFGLILAVSALRFLTFLLPVEYASVIVGQKSNWRKWWKGFLWGLLFYPLVMAAALVVGVTVSWIIHEPRQQQTVITFLTNLDHGSFPFWLLIGSIIFIVPYVEEILFRGFLQGFLGGILHPVFVTLSTSVIFSLFHYSPLQKSGNFEIMFGLFVFSLLASRLRLREDAVIATVGMHTAFNLISLVLFCTP